MLSWSHTSVKPQHPRYRRDARKIPTYSRKKGQWQLGIAASHAILFSFSPSGVKASLLGRSPRRPVVIPIKRNHFFTPRPSTLPMRIAQKPPLNPQPSHPTLPPYRDTAQRRLCGRWQFQSSVKQQATLRRWLTVQNLRRRESGDKN